MAIVYRGVKGSRLTVSEIDGNFEYLSDEVNTKVDSSEVRGIVDSAYIQARQLSFDFMDSAEVIALIDSAYIQARVNFDNTLDSNEVLGVIQNKLQNLSYSIIPDSNEVYDLGSSSKRFKDLYLSGSTLNLGGVSLKKENDNSFSIGTDLIGGEAFAAGWWDTQWFKVGPKTGGPEIKVRIDDTPSDPDNQLWISFLENIQPGDTFTIETPVQQTLIVTSTVTPDHFSSYQYRFYFGVDVAPSITGNDAYVYRVSTSLSPANNIKIKYSAADDSDWGGVSPTNVSSALDILAKNLKDNSDSSTVTDIVDSAYINARLDTTAFLDSAEVIALIDSQYIQVRQTTYNIDSAYVQARQITYNFDSDIQNITTSILPATTEAIDLGSETKRFRDLYLSGNSIVMGSLTLTDSNGKLIVKDSGGVTAPIAVSTTNVTEGDNLFYTTARFDSDFNDKTTTNLTEGTQKYYTSARADSDARHALTGGTGVTYVKNTGTISIGQSVGTSDSVIFQGLQVDNLTVSGTQTIVNTQTLNVVDPMIKLADSNQADINDIGFFGQYSNDGGVTTRHTGLFRDASDKQYYLYSQLVDAPTTFVDRNGVDFELSTLNVGTINASNILDSGHIENMIRSLSTDSAAVFLLVDSAYVQQRQAHYLDSSATIALINSTVTKTVPAGNTAEILRANMGTNDQFRILVGGANNAGYAEIATADDGTEPIYVRQYTGVFSSIARTLTLLDASGNTTMPGSLRTYGNILPGADSTYDLGSPSEKWRELHLSGNTIYLGNEKLSASDGSLKLNNKSLFNYTSQDDALVQLSDRFVETSDELTDAQVLVSPIAVTSTWGRFAHLGTSQPLAEFNGTKEYDAWFYNSSNQAIENPLNTATATGFYSPKSYTDYTHEVTMSGTTSADDDPMGVIIGYVIENGQHYTLSAIRQTHGGFIQSGLTWGLVYNMGQNGHTDTTRNQALLVNGSSLGTASVGITNNWNSFPNGVRVQVVKSGSSISIKTSEFNSTTLDNNTEITFDLLSDSRTQRFAGAVPYGYIAQSQGPASFSNIVFTSPTQPESIIHFKKNGATDFFVYNNNTAQWDADTTSSLSTQKGKFYHNSKTGRTFFNDGNNVFPIGTVRQFNDVIYQIPLSSAPNELTIGSLGLQPGMIAMADGINWNPGAKSTGRPYPVFWDGVNWLAMV